MILVLSTHATHTPSSLFSFPPYPINHNTRVSLLNLVKVFSSLKMDRIFVGSSNVYRFYRPELYKEFTTYNVARCTDIILFKAVMENLEESETGVVVSVIKNFLSRSIEGGAGAEAVLVNFGETIDSFMSIVKAAATRLPNSRFALADPIKRPKIIQYQNHFEDIIQAFSEAVTFARRDNITRIDAIAEGCQQFEEDQVHLTGASGQIFIEGLLSKSKAFFDAPIVDLINDENEPEVTSVTDKLTVRLDNLEKQVKIRRNEDNVVFARIREEMDSATNRQKEDKIVITGITSSVYPPPDLAQRKVWLRKIVDDVIKSIVPDFAGQIVYVNQGRSMGKMIPLVEVKLDSVENASLIRKAFAEKKKSGTDLGRLFIANCVNLATRVRVDILKALARKVSNSNTVAYAVPFVSRPVMQIRSKESGMGSEARSFSFTDAVSKYGHLLKHFELAEAYRRAGNHFVGQMEQQFLVLREQSGGQNGGPRPRTQAQQQPHRGHYPEQAGAGGSRKRIRDEDDDGHDWSKEPEPSPSRGRGHPRGNRFGYKRPWRGNSSYRR
jgi:hypothetical protein